MGGKVGVVLGFTVIEKLIGVPVQPDKVGVTVIKPEIEFVPGFAEVKLGMFELPEALSPMLVLLFVQLKVAPLVPVKVIVFTVCPSQLVISFT